MPSPSSVVVFSVFGEIVEKAARRMVVWPAQGNFVREGLQPADAHLIIEPGAQEPISLGVEGICVIGVHLSPDGMMKTADFTWNTDRTRSPREPWEHNRVRGVFSARWEPVRRMSIWERLAGDDPVYEGA